jgi:hypothetical protein
VRGPTIWLILMRPPRAERVKLPQLISATPRRRDRSQ